MTRIPRIKFPLRRPQSSTSTSGTVSQTKAPSETNSSHKIPSSKAPSPTTSGTASEQPKRTPLSDKEIEAVLLGGGA